MSQDIELAPINKIEGIVNLPGDKSISHRALIISAISSGISKIYNLADGWDVLATKQALRKLGVEITDLSQTLIEVKGVYGSKNLQEPKNIISCLNSGTTARLLVGLISGANIMAVLTGDESLLRRPMKRVIEPINMMGAIVYGRQNNNYLPVFIKGKYPLRAIDYELKIASAQVKSAIILSALAAEGITQISGAINSRDHTENMLLYTGVKIQVENEKIKIWGNQVPQPTEWFIPADSSSAAVFAVAAAIHKNSYILIPNVLLNPRRAKFLDILSKMGASVEVTRQTRINNELVGDIIVKSRELKGITITKADIVDVIDEIPVLAVAMCKAEGTSEVSGAKELRVKESDRISSLVQEFRKFGVEIYERDDGFKIIGNYRSLNSPPYVSSHSDHRIAMALVLLASVSKGTTVLKGAEWLNISFPTFFREWYKVSR